MTQDTQPRGQHRLGLSRTSMTVIGAVIAASLVATAAFEGVEAFREPSAVAGTPTEPEKVGVSILDRIDAEGVKVGDEVYVPADVIDEAFDLEQEEADGRLRLATTLSQPTIFTAHDPKGSWLGGEKNRVEEWGDVRMDDATGLPKFLHNGQLDFLPITVAHYGLQHWSIWALEGNAESLDKAAAPPTGSSTTRRPRADGRPCSTSSSSPV